MTITLEEYNALSPAELRALNDDQYGTVGGWEDGSEGNDQHANGRMRYRKGRKTARSAD